MSDTHLACQCGKLVLVDPDWFENLKRKKIGCLKGQSITAFHNGKYTTLGRHILGIVDQGRNVQCDHINRDPHDNRRKNLRMASNYQNSLNRKLYSTNTSGYRGVLWNKATKSWRASITLKGVTTYIGLFSDPKNAAEAYDEMARLHHKDLAQLNFPCATTSHH